LVYRFKSVIDRVLAIHHIWGKLAALPFNGPQTYVFHCHNLEHEDGGMMLGVKVA